MARSKTPAKRHRQSLVRRDRNRSRRTAARTAVREARELIAAGKKEEAGAAVQAASAVLDRTARKGAIHPNKAARQKSRLMRALTAGPAPTVSKRSTRTTRARPPRTTAG